MRVRVAEDRSLLKNYDLPFLDLESRLFRSDKLWTQITSFLNYERVIKYANYGGCCMSQRNTAYLLSVQKQITLHKQTYSRGTRKCKYNAALNIHRLFHFLCCSTVLFLSVVPLNIRIQYLNEWFYSQSMRIQVDQSVPYIFSQYAE
jgi:hypothetical protein